MSYPHFSNDCHEYHDVVADYTGHYHGRPPQDTTERLRREGLL